MSATLSWRTLRHFFASIAVKSFNRKDRKEHRKVRQDEP
jgi:hypothetical protein